MSYILTGLVFFIVFSILVLVHEFGHFFMAKRAGIKVEEFGFGLPPRIWGKKKGETIYSINWIPFGGFVRMYGEDSHDPASLRSSRSFVAKPMRARIKVIVAGVVMNFILAWLLIFIGFSFGMQPLLGPEDILPAIDSGKIVTEPGVKIQEIQAGSLAEKSGFKVNDLIVSFDGKTVDDLALQEIAENPSGDFGVIRDGVLISTKVAAGELEDLGVQMYDFASFPRVKIFKLEKYTQLYAVGLRPGDIILEVNDSQVYTVQDLEQLIRGVSTLEYDVYRDGVVQKFIIENTDTRQVIASQVLPDAPAFKAGLQPEDVIITVDGKVFFDSAELIAFIQENPDKALVYNVNRAGQNLFFEIKPENGLIGVYFSELMNYGAQSGVSIYDVDVVSSVVEIKDEKYPVHVAAYKSLSETFRLSSLTAEMFVGFIGNLVRSGEVPDSIAGPIGIAQMTHVFVQEGIIPLLRFVAILSLSLAVINILPFPALDGGRLLFILIEFVIGRRVPQKWEAYIHALGYVLILLLIFVVTYSDILRLIAE